MIICTVNIAKQNVSTKYKYIKNTAFISETMASLMLTYALM